jgi:hypothetical protein
VTNLETANTTLNTSVTNLITNASGQQTKIDTTNSSVVNLRAADVQMNTTANIKSLGFNVTADYDARYCLPSGTNCPAGVTDTNNGGVSNWSLIQSPDRSIVAAFNLTTINVTQNLTYTVNSIGNWSLDKTSYVTYTVLNGQNNFTLAQMVANFGNWTLDKASYSTTAQEGGLYLGTAASGWANTSTLSNTLRNVSIGSTASNGMLYVNGTVGLNTTGVVTIAGNVTIYTNGTECFNPTCTSRIFYNGTHTVIQ